MSFASTAYSKTASYFHWFAAVPMIGCVGTVLKAQQAPKEDKGKWMFRHKSLYVVICVFASFRDRSI
jgi:cytochrome b561